MNLQWHALGYIRTITADLPFTVQQLLTSDKIRMQNISDYYKEKIFGREYLTDIFCIDNVTYFNFNLPFVIPLNQIIQRLEQQPELNQNQILIINKICEQIIYQTNELYTKRALYHNQICSENILIISNLDHIYTWDKLESFEIKFINFANTVNHDEAYKVDINQLKELLGKLLRLSNNNINIQNLNNHFDFQNLIHPIQNQIFRNIILFKPKNCTQQQEQQLNQILNLPTNEYLKKPILLLRSMVFQLQYINKYEMIFFESLLEELQIVERLISTFQEEFEQYYRFEINSQKQQINQYFKFQMDEEIQKYLEKFLTLFGENLFVEYFQYSQFNYNHTSLNFCKQKACQLLEQSKNQIKQLISESYKIIVFLKIQDLVIELI